MTRDVAAVWFDEDGEQPRESARSGGDARGKAIERLGNFLDSLATYATNMGEHVDLQTLHLDVWLSDSPTSPGGRKVAAWLLDALGLVAVDTSLVEKVESASDDDGPGPSAAA